MTEAEAKTKACPFIAGFNASHGGADPPTCIATRCAAWFWTAWARPEHPDAPFARSANEYEEGAFPVEGDCRRLWA